MQECRDSKLPENGRAVPRLRHSSVGLPSRVSAELISAPVSRCIRWYVNCYETVVPDAVIVLTKAEERHRCMNTTPGVTTLVIPAVYEEALQRVRKIFKHAGLEILMEFDCSARICHQFGMQVPQCRILFVDSPSLLLEAMTTGVAAATMYPVHVAVSEQGSTTMAAFLSLTTIYLSDFAIGVKTALSKLHSEIGRSLQSADIHNQMTG